MAQWQHSHWGDPVWEEWVLGPETLNLLSLSQKLAPTSVPLTQPVLVVVCPSEPSEAEMDLLVKILAAIHLTLDQVLLHCGPVSDWKSWTGSRLIAFGCKPELPSGQPVPDTWARGSSLTQMLEDPEAKKSLWLTIKNWKHLES